MVECRICGQEIDKMEIFGSADFVVCRECIMGIIANYKKIRKTDDDNGAAAAQVFDMFSAIGKQIKDLKE